jgi:hypothetical protein
MRYLLTVILLIMIPTSITQASPDLERARDAFWSSKFGTAADLYRDLAKQYPKHANIWYNLGTAEAMADRMGPATYALEQCLALQPNHADAAHNLEKIRQWVTSKALALSSNKRLVLPGNDDAGTGLLAAMPLSEIRVLFAVSWALLFLLIYGLRRSSSRRTAVSFLIILVGLVSVSSGGLLLTRSYVVDQARYGVILATTPARQGPGKQYSVQTQVSNSVKVSLGGQDREWTQVVLPNGQGGWIATRSIGVIGH